MTLLLDSFSTEVQSRLEAAGWVLTSMSRYDPTTVVGLTPSGKSFTFTASGSTIRVVVAGNTRTASIAKATWEPGAATVTALLQVWNALPAGQR